eukprot:1160863-Pelagomonas_calceolata.AAC.4
MALHARISGDLAPKLPTPVIHSADLPASAPCGRSTSLASESIPSSSTPTPVGVAGGGIGGAGDEGTAGSGADAAPAAPNTSTRAGADNSDTGVLPAAHPAPPATGAAIEDLAAFLNTQEAPDLMPSLYQLVSTLTFLNARGQTWQA